MKVQIEKGMSLRIFVYSLLNNDEVDGTVLFAPQFTFKTEIFEFETDFIYEYEPDSDFNTVYKLLQLELNLYKPNQDFVNDEELIIDNNIFESFYKKIFDYFINNFGNKDDWEENIFVIELQALDSNRNVIFQTEGFGNYETIEG